MAGDRETSLDTLRGIALCMVICIHISAHPLTLFSASSSYGFDFWFAHFLNSFSRVSVPIFVLISGRFLLSKREGVTEFYKKRVSRIVIVALLWGLLYELFSSISTGAYLPLVSLQNILTGNTVHHLWYLYMLIGLYLLTPFLQKLRATISKKELWIVAIVSLLGGMGLSAYDAMSQGQMPFLLWGLKYVGYFVFGYIIGQTTLNFSRPFLLSTYFISSCCILFGTYYTVRTSGSFFLYSYLTPFVVIGSLALYTYFSKTRFKENFFSRLSPLVLGIYLIHIFFLDIVDTFMSNIGLSAYYGAFYVLMFKGVTIFFMSYCSVKWLIKIPLLKRLF